MTTLMRACLPVDAQPRHTRENNTSEDPAAQKVTIFADERKTIDGQLGDTRVSRKNGTFVVNGSPQAASQLAVRVAAPARVKLGAAESTKSVISRILKELWARAQRSPTETIQEFLGETVWQWDLTTLPPI